MANAPGREKGGAPALDAVRTEREADDATRAKEAGTAGGSAPVSGDSPKPHGDKMEHAVREAAGNPAKGKT